MSERRWGIKDKSGIRWLATKKDVTLLGEHLLGMYFRPGHISESEIRKNPGLHFKYVDDIGNVVIIEGSGIAGYQVVTWTRGCESVIADCFGGFDPFSAAPPPKI